MTDVVGMGEAMVLLEPEKPGPLEAASRLMPRVAGAEMNLCAAVSRLGLKASFCSRVGADPWGRKVIDTLEKLKIDVGPVASDPDAPTGVFFKEALPDGERRVYYYRKGSAASRMEYEDSVRALETQPKALIVSGITLALGEGPAEATLTAARLAKEAGSWVVVDPNLRAPLGGLRAIEPMLRSLLPLCDILLSGRDEAAQLFGSNEPQSILQVARRSGVSEVVLKDGSWGCWYEEEGGLAHLTPESVEELDPVGAGDAFGGGYLSARLSGAPPRAAARLGSTLGAMVAGSEGDVEGLPTESVADYMMARCLHS